MAVRAKHGAPSGVNVNVDTVSLVAGLRYKPGWVFKIGGPGNTLLCVFATTPDSQHPTRQRTTQHQFPLPDLSGLELVRWVFDQLILVELHEAGEFFQIDGRRPFFPHHQDEGSPYEHVERWET